MEKSRESSKEGSGKLQRGQMRMSQRETRLGGGDEDSFSNENT